jgi:twitching motility protein PilT
LDINILLKEVADSGASDLHLRVGLPPVYRVDGRLMRQEQYPAISSDDTEAFIRQIATTEQIEKLREMRELDFACVREGLARFRVNAMWQRKTISIACRMLTLEVPSVEKLELPPICKDLILKPRGLILVTGPTGVGKSTTMAAMIRHLNENRECNVVCIEDPIEYVHPDIKSIIAQRELGDDTYSFSEALTRSLRHDPDVIVVGEMRDLDTISTAITAAETGHLVMSTLHTADAAQTIDRLIDVFPAHQQDQIRVQISQQIVAILSQTLLPRASGKGMVAAFEIVIANNAIRNLIRENRSFEIPSYIHLHDDLGMQSLEDALAQLVQSGTISRQAALAKTSNPKRLQRMLEESRYR